MGAVEHRALANLPADELLAIDLVTHLSLTADTVVQTALVLNTAAKGRTFQNDADKACYLKLGAGASPTSYTVKLSPKDANNIGGFTDLGALRLYNGIVTAIWDAGVTGALRMTEGT